MKRIGYVLVLTLIADVVWGQALKYPVDVAVDAEGKVFVADHYARALLKLEKGAFTVIARGEGAPRTALFGIRQIAPEKEGRWIVSDPGTMKLYRIDAAADVTPLPDGGRLVSPWGVAVEPSGTILVADRTTQLLSRLTPDGEIKEVASIAAPRSIFFDKDGSVLVLTDRNVVRVTENGEKEALLTDSPFELAHDGVLHPNGNLYVADGYAMAIWQVTPAGETSQLVQGEPLMNPQGLAVDASGNLLVADPHASTIFKVTTKGEVSVLAK
jgi:streptogramin lyase